VQFSLHENSSSRLLGETSSASPTTYRDADGQS
jgi:hypothetical protein